VSLVVLELALVAAAVEVDVCALAVSLAISVLALIVPARLSVLEPLQGAMSYGKAVGAWPIPSNRLVWLWARVPDAAARLRVCDPVWVPWYWLCDRSAGVEHDHTNTYTKGQPLDRATLRRVKLTGDCHLDAWHDTISSRARSPSTDIYHSAVSSSDENGSGRLPDRM